MKISPKPKLVVVLGLTATGKSDLAVELARKYNGEIISADSRQVFKGMDLGSGKITKKEMLGIKHHLLNVVGPNTSYNVVKFQKTAHQVISQILERGKLPILCGGTGFYIQAIVENTIFPNVGPNAKLRSKLEKFTTAKLLNLLKKLDILSYERIDKNNRVRIIRAIEIAKTLGSVPTSTIDPIYNTLQIGLDAEDELLKDRIHRRLLKRIKKGMINEVKKLHTIKHVSWKRLESFGLEYRFIAQYLQNKISYKNMISGLSMDIWHFAKRQRTWFRRDKHIKWFKLEQKKKIFEEIRKFV